MGTTCFLISTAEATKSVIERENRQPYEPGHRHGFDFDFLTVKGSTGYGIMHRQDKDTGEKIHFGIVFKTSRHRTSSPGTTEFCIKEITESMGPVQSQAPAKMLDMLDRLAPNPTGYALQWRNRCRENLKAKPTTKPTEGQRVMYQGTAYTLIFPRGPRKGWTVCTDNGARYRMNARQVAEALKEPTPPPAEPPRSKEVSPEEFFRAHVQFVHIGDRPNVQP